MSTFDHGIPIADGHSIRTGHFRCYERRRRVLDMSVNNIDRIVWHVFRSVIIYILLIWHMHCRQNICLLILSNLKEYEYYQLPPSIHRNVMIVQQKKKIQFLLSN